VRESKERDKNLKKLFKWFATTTSERDKRGEEFSKKL